MYIEETLNFIRQLYSPDNSGCQIGLHEPSLSNREKQLVGDCIDSTFVSSVGKYVTQFEEMIAQYVGLPYAVAATNGTAALHLALLGIGVQKDDLVLTQALSFVATANPILYCGAEPVFIDSAVDNPGMCPDSLEQFLSEFCRVQDGVCIHLETGRVVRACMPMHVFGHPAKMDEIVVVCEKFKISVVEDAAEALGSFYKGKHVGHHGKASIFSFNGNKIVTCGGGGVVVTSDPVLAKHLKHISTTAKIPHSWDFFHDQLGFNYRMPNLNAALGCAQLEKISDFVQNKRETAAQYRQFFAKKNIVFLDEPKDCKSNFWLNAILLENSFQRDQFLKASQEAQIQSRPVWKLLPSLPFLKKCMKTSLKNSESFEARIVNLPSSVRKA